MCKTHPTENVAKFPVTKRGALLAGKGGPVNTEVSLNQMLTIMFAGLSQKRLWGPPHPSKFDKTISNGPEGVLSIFEGGLGVGQDKFADLSSVFCSVLVEHELQKLQTLVV